MLLNQPLLGLFEDDTADKAQQLKKGKVLLRLLDVLELVPDIRIWLTLVHDLLECALVALPVNLVMEAKVINSKIVLRTRPVVIHNTHNVGWKLDWLTVSLLFIMIPQFMRNRDRTIDSPQNSCIKECRSAQRYILVMRQKNVIQAVLFSVNQVIYFYIACILEVILFIHSDNSLLDNCLKLLGFRADEENEDLMLLRPAQ